MSQEPVPLIDFARHALFLDFDGTLAEFADHPDSVIVPKTLTDDLIEISLRSRGALAIISGRTIESVDRQMQPLRLPAAGVHGLETRFDDEIVRNYAEARRLDPARDIVTSLLSDDDPIKVEDKGGAIVLHYRMAPKEAERARKIARDAADVDEALVAINGAAIAEIRPRAITKAGAIHAFCQNSPFAGRVPVFVGDDTTDEDGFRAADELGGYGIKVGDGETAARYRLPDVGSVHRWLSESLDN